MFYLIFPPNSIPRPHTIYPILLGPPNQTVLSHLLNQRHLKDTFCNCIIKEIPNKMHIPLFNIRQHKIFNSNIIRTLLLVITLFDYSNYLNKDKTIIKSKTKYKQERGIHFVTRGK